jgi:hypothetical protein
MNELISTLKKRHKTEDERAAACFDKLSMTIVVTLSPSKGDGL